jgi:hypothetical protein
MPEGAVIKHFKSWLELVTCVEWGRDGCNYMEQQPQKVYTRETKMPV